MRITLRPCTRPPGSTIDITDEICEGDTARAIYITLAMGMYFTGNFWQCWQKLVSTTPKVSATPVGVSMNEFGNFLLTKNPQNMAKMIKNLIKKCCDFLKSASRLIYLRQNRIFLNPHVVGFGYPNYVGDTPFLTEWKKHLCASYEWGCGIITLHIQKIFFLVFAPLIRNMYTIVDNCEHRFYSQVW